MEMDKINEIGSVEYIRAHIQKMNERNNAAIDLFGECGPNETCPICPHGHNCESQYREMDKQAHQHMQEIGACLR